MAIRRLQPWLYAMKTNFERTSMDETWIRRRRLYVVVLASHQRLSDTDPEQVFARDGCPGENAPRRTARKASVKTVACGQAVAGRLQAINGVTKRAMDMSERVSVVHDVQEYVLKPNVALGDVDAGQQPGER